MSYSTTTLLYCSCRLLAWLAPCFRLAWALIRMLLAQVVHHTLEGTILPEVLLVVEQS
jgi:hypothetical protein